MRLAVVPACLSLGLLCACQQDAPDEAPPGSPPVAPPPVVEVQPPPGPPPSRREDHVDTLHGVAVPDPYRWLEQPADTPEVRAWIQRQNEWSARYFDGLDQRQALVDRLEQIWRFDRMQPPRRHSGWWLSQRQGADQNQPVLYIQAALDETPRMLLDPNAKDAEGGVSLHQYAVSPDGTLLAWSYLEAGSDWQTLRVRDIASGMDHGDRLRWIKYSDIAWTHDNAGFFYSRYPRPEGDALTSANRDHELWYHRLGTSQDEDVLIYHRPDQPEWRFVADISPDGRWLVVQVRHGTDRRHRLYVMDLKDPASPDLEADMIRVVDTLEAGFHFIGQHHDGRLLLRTDHGAPRGRVIAIDPAQPDPGDWLTVVAERDHPIAEVRPRGDGLVVQYMEDVRSILRLFDAGGEESGEIPLPMPGSVSGLSANADSEDVFFSFQSFLHPPTVFRHTPGDETPDVYFDPGLAVDLSPYVIRYLLYQSGDGTAVPLYVVMRRDQVLNGNHPTLLYAYGGFNISILPGFSPETVAWLEQGGIYALASIRGGGEFGSDWHRAGQRERRQTVYNDFIAAAEYLIDQDYTRPGRLGIHGRSNGGLLVGAVINQRPELFAAAVPAVGVMDMLRFHRFTVGAGWIPEFGDPDDARDFQHLLAISPLHNVRSQAYPAVLVTTADHDDRVVPGHSFKYAAALQQAQEGEAPVLIRIETRAGHGAGTPTRVLIDQAADRLAFLLHELGGD